MTTLTPESLCDTANTAFEHYQQLAAQADTIQEEFRESTQLDSDARNPFDAHYELDRAIDTVRRNLRMHVVQRLNAMLVPNIPISVDALPRDLDKHFDAHTILALIRKQYVRDAVRKSREAILSKVRRLLPRAGYKEQLTREQLLKKNVVTLHKYVRAGSGGSASFSRDDECDALQKLVRIILEDADPVTVDTGTTAISSIHQARKFEEIFYDIVFESGWIQKVKSFKNSKFMVTFKAETAAQRVAQFLIDNQTAP